MKRTLALFALVLILLGAAPAGAAWRTESSGTVFAVYYCAADARAQKVPALVRWKYGSADAITQVIVATWLHVATVASSANCTAGQTEIVWRMQRTVADAIADAFLRGEGVDVDAMTTAQIADAVSLALRDDLLQWEAEHNAYLAAQQAPPPDPVEPLN